MEILFRTGLNLEILSVFLFFRRLETFLGMSRSSGQLERHFLCMCELGAQASKICSIVPSWRAGSDWISRILQCGHAQTISDHPDRLFCRYIDHNCVICTVKLDRLHMQKPGSIDRAG